jgi:hypothetical protein
MAFVTAFSEAHEWKDKLFGLTWPAIVTIYGVPKSGKTYLLLNLLEHIKKEFDEIICYLGAKDATQTFLNLAGKKTKPVVKILYQFDEKDLRKYYQKLEETQMALIKAKKEPKKILIVADDILTFSGFMKTNRQSPSILEEISANYRHINLSMIITSQRYMQVIPALRSLNFKYMFICSLGKKDIEKMADEHENMFFDKNDLEEIFFDIRKNGLGHILLIDNNAFDKDRVKYVHPDNSITKIVSKKDK